jgi:hypothetical protein
MTFGDYRLASEPNAKIAGTPDSTLVWAVLIVGTFTPMNAPGPLPWGIWVMDAHDGSAIGSVAGPGTVPAYWDSLPDHSSS